MPLPKTNIVVCTNFLSSCRHALCGLLVRLLFGSGHYLGAKLDPIMANGLDMTSVLLLHTMVQLRLTL